MSVTGVLSMLPRVGQRFVLTVAPPDWYVGKVGARAVVQEASAQAIYVVFDSGQLESFPPLRFAEFFRPEVSETRPVPAVSAPTGPWIERTPSGRIRLHR
jgi:hypothetical protein